MCFKEESDFCHQVDLKDRFARSSGVLISTLAHGWRTNAEMSMPMSHMHVQPTPTLTHIFYPDVPMQSHTHTGKCHESSSCVTCMRICRSTEAHHLPATLADRTKEETATRKVEIMTSTFINKNAITQPAHSPCTSVQQANLPIREMPLLWSDFSMFYFSDSHSPLLEAHHHGCWVHWSQPWLGGRRHKHANKEPSKLQLVSSSIIHTFNTMELALLMFPGRKFY